MFALQAQGWIHLALLVVVVVVQVAAIISCSLQRADAFAAIGTLTKPLWLALLFGLLLVTFLFGVLGTGGSSWALIAVIGGIVYLVDVRPAIRDIGTNPW